jgi:mannose-1-phosphate guanylyltransferase
MAIGILLVGGMGTRLKPLTNQTPKPMLPVAGMPVTERQLLAAKKAGINTVILATSYLSEVFTPYFGDGSKWGMKLLYAVEREPLGTGGAIRNAASSVDFADSSEEFVIFNGDVLSGHDIAAQLDFHRRNQADATLHLIEVADARAFGCVPTDSNGKVLDFLEKMEHPITNAINAGCYIFNSSVISQIPEDTVVSIERETFPKLVESDRPVFGYNEQSYWLDIGTPAALFQGSRDFVGEGFLAGTGSQIGEGSVITGGTSIGQGSTIGANCRITNSIIGDGVEIGDSCTISDSFILHNSQLAASSEIIGKYISPTENLPISAQ